MNFNKERTTAALYTTEVENLFINDYMPEAPGDYVKVYLYGQLCSGFQNSLSDSAFAAQLGLSLKEVKDAWDYWEEKGLVRKHLNGIEFLSIREMLYADGDSAAAGSGIIEKHTENSHRGPDNETKSLLNDVEIIMGRTLTARELQEIGTWLEYDGVAAEVIREAFRYAAGRGKGNINYISKIVLEWHEKGFETEEEVRANVVAFEERQGFYYKVIDALGLKRNPTAAEKRMIDSWLDELGFTEIKIMEAADKAGFNASPNLKYVNKVLENWAEDALREGRDQNSTLTVTQNSLNKYYEFLREEAKKAAAERISEIYRNIPRVKEIDEGLKNMGSRISKGLLLGMTGNEVESLRDESTSLETERAELLKNAGYEPDYTEVRYLCSSCHDTGIDEKGGRCACRGKRMGEAEVWEKSRKIKS